MEEKGGETGSVLDIDIKGSTGIKLPQKQQYSRTTFRLSEKGHEAVKKASEITGATNAVVFETIVPIFNDIKKNKTNLRWPSNKKDKYIRRTYVIKKNTLSKIKKICKEEGIPRDLFVDTMSKLLSVLFDKEISEKERKYRDVLNKIINPFWGKAEKVEKELEKELGEDDPIVRRFGVVCVVLMSLSLDIEGYINNGEPIDPDSM